MLDHARADLPRCRWSGWVLAAISLSYFVVVVSDAEVPSQAPSDSRDPTCEAPKTMSLVQAKTRNKKVKIMNGSDDQDDIDINFLGTEPQDTGTTLLAMPANESVNGAESWVVTKSILTEDPDKFLETLIDVGNSTRRVDLTLAKATNLSQATDFSQEENPSVAFVESNSSDGARGWLLKHAVNAQYLFTNVQQMLQQGIGHHMQNSRWTSGMLHGRLSALLQYDHVEFPFGTNPTLLVVVTLLLFTAIFWGVLLACTHQEKDDHADQPVMLPQTPGALLSESTRRPMLEKTPMIVTSSPHIKSRGPQESVMPITAPLQFSGGGGLEVVFCPDLIVPAGCECILCVPVKPVNKNSPFEVTDANGNVVLGVQERILSPHSGRPSAANRAQYSASDAPKSMRRLVVCTAAGDLLAQCCAVVPSQPPGEYDSVEFHLLRASGDYFATLSRGASTHDQFGLQSLSGQHLHFWGSFGSQYHAMNITDDEGKLIATTEACSVVFDGSCEYYRLRVAPLTDVGLVLCSLLCIEHLGEGQY